MDEELGLTKEELEAFFRHLDKFCSECKCVPRGRSPVSCKNPGCLVYPIRLVHRNLRTRPSLDKLLLQKRRPPVEDKPLYDNQVHL